LLKNAIRDKNLTMASYFVSKLSVDSLKKKDPVGLSRVFVMSMVSGMVAVALQFLEKGFPKDVNAPALEIVIDGGNRLESPSYFILAVSYGLEDVVNSMTRVSAAVTSSFPFHPRSPRPIFDNSREMPP